MRYRCSHGLFSYTNIAILLIIRINKLYYLQENELKSKSIIDFCVAGSLLVVSTGSYAVDQNQSQSQDQIQQKSQIQDQDRIEDRDRDRIYGSHLMTSQERTEYRANMRNLKTEREREAYLFEHHKKMQERARERNLNLPDNPPVRGGGIGPSGGASPRGGGR